MDLALGLLLAGTALSSLLRWLGLLVFMAWLAKRSPEALADAARVIEAYRRWPERRRDGRSIGPPR